MLTESRALLVLAAYDYESLALTLQSLEHTLDPAEKVVVVVNGKRHHIAGEKVERVAREWAARNPASRFVVRPMSAGKSAYHALTEAMAHYEPLRQVRYICKIDDDLVPLRAGWMERLAAAYEQKAAQGKVGFVTGLINNNCWGFNELVQLSGRMEEYRQMFNYTSVAGDNAERRVPAGTIDVGMGGTVWNYPYLAWWIHQWTSLKPAQYVDMTKGLPPQEIATATHYSIGCVFFEKQFWLDMSIDQYGTDFDELMMHRNCRDKGASKWALMDEPMVHLFYRTQRHANAALLPDLKAAFTAFYNDPAFTAIPTLNTLDTFPAIDEYVNEMRPRISYLFNKVTRFSWGRRLKEKRLKRKMAATA